MNILDLLFIVILFFSFLFGMIRGLVRELLSLFFLVAALVLAFLHHHDAGLLLGGLIRNRGLADFTGFLLVLALVAAAGALFTMLVSKILVVGPLKGVDRILGAAFGLLRGILLCGLVIYGFSAFPLNRQPLQRSQLAPVLTRVLIAGIQVLPPALRDKLNDIQIHDSKKNNRTGRTV